MMRVYDEDFSGTLAAPTGPQAPWVRLSPTPQRLPIPAYVSPGATPATATLALARRLPCVRVLATAPVKPPLLSLPSPVWRLRGAVLTAVVAVPTVTGAARYSRTHAGPVPC
jgi:hypothetical protein